MSGSDYGRAGAAPVAGAVPPLAPDGALFEGALFAGALFDGAPVDGALLAGAVFAGPVFAGGLTLLIVVVDDGPANGE